jgi:hypothetical protein
MRFASISALAISSFSSATMACFLAVGEREAVGMEWPDEPLLA